MRTVQTCLVVAALLAACGPEATSRPKNPLDDAPPATKGSHLDPSVPVPVEDKPQPWDAEQGKIALARAAKNAATCVDVVGGDGPRGIADVSVVFASNGHSVRASVPPPFEGTPIGQCVVRAFVGIIVPPFEGNEVTVEQPVELKAAPPAPAASASAAPKPAASAAPKRR